MTLNRLYVSISLCTWPTVNEQFNWFSFRSVRGECGAMVVATLHEFVENICQKIEQN